MEFQSRLFSTFAVIVKGMFWNFCYFIMSFVGFHCSVYNVLGCGVVWCALGFAPGSTLSENIFCQALVCWWGVDLNFYYSINFYVRCLLVLRMPVSYQTSSCYYNSFHQCAVVIIYVVILVLCSRMAQPMILWFAPLDSSSTLVSMQQICSRSFNGLNEIISMSTPNRCGLCSLSNFLFFDGLIWEIYALR